MPRPHTDWSPLRDHLRRMRLSPGQRVLLTTGDLRQILRVSTLPDSVSRVTSWDPIMGKSTGGLQSVLNEARLLPMAFEWEGDPDSRPQLRWVVLVRWGSGVTT